MTSGRSLKDRSKKEEGNDSGRGRGSPCFGNNKEGRNLQDPNGNKNKRVRRIMETYELQISRDECTTVAQTMGEEEIIPGGKGSSEF